MGEWSEDQLRTATQLYGQKKALVAMREALDAIQQVGSVRGGAWCAGQAIRALAGQPLLPLDGTLPPSDQREGSR